MDYSTRVLTHDTVFFHVKTKQYLDLVSLYLTDYWQHSSLRLINKIRSRWIFKNIEEERARNFNTTVSLKVVLLVIGKQGSIQTFHQGTEYKGFPSKCLRIITGEKIIERRKKVIAPAHRYLSSCMHVELLNQKLKV